VSGEDRDKGERDWGELGKSMLIKSNARGKRRGKGGGQGREAYIKIGSSKISMSEGEGRVSKKNKKTRSKISV